MDAKVELEKAKTKRQELVDQINMLSQEVARFEQKKQALLQELLKTEGAIEVLERISKDGAT